MENATPDYAAGLVSTQVGGGPGRRSGCCLPSVSHWGLSAGTHAGVWGPTGPGVDTGPGQGLLGVPSAPRGGRTALPEGVPAPRPLRCGGCTGRRRASPCPPGSSGEHCRAVCSHSLERTGFSLYHLYVARQASLDFFPQRQLLWGGGGSPCPDRTAQPSRPPAAPGWGSGPEGSGPRARLGGTWPLSSRNSCL